MLEFIGAFALTWWFFLAVFSMVIWTIHVESDAWSFFWVAVLGTVAYFFFNIPLVMLGYGALAYIPLGIVWSIYRWKRYCKRTFEGYTPNKKEIDPWGSANEYDKAQVMRLLDPKRQINKIVTWVFVWPFSLLDNLIGDLIDAVESFIRKYLITIYNNIAGNYLDQLK